MQHRSAAELRHRELTQEIFDIGDEVASYIENLIEAIEDYDAQLVADCLSELDEIIADACHDARLIAVELPGLRHALTSGIRAGAMSARSIPMDRPVVIEPVIVSSSDLSEQHPESGSPVVVSQVVEALEGRTRTAVWHLRHLVEWVLDGAERTADDPQGINFGQILSRAKHIAYYTARAWRLSVIDTHPGVARTLRGRKPPRFLVERARVDAIVAKVAARQQAARAGATGAAS